MGVYNGGVRYIVGWGADGNDDCSYIQSRGTAVPPATPLLPKFQVREQGTVGTYERVAEGAFLTAERSYKREAFKKSAIYTKGVRTCVYGEQGGRRGDGSPPAPHKLFQTSRGCSSGS